MAKIEKEEIQKFSRTISFYLEIIVAGGSQNGFINPLYDASKLKKDDWKFDPEKPPQPKIGDISPDGKVSIKFSAAVKYKLP